MKLERILFAPSVQVKFTRRELSVLMQLSAMHYDSLCKAASKPGRDGFLWGIKNGNESLTWQECNLLAKICEGASFWERSSRPIDQQKAKVGRRLFAELLRLLKAMENAFQLTRILGEKIAEQSNIQERKPYFGPLPYQGEEKQNEHV
jgi:hypothetical protein